MKQQLLKSAWLKSILSSHASPVRGGRPSPLKVWSERQSKRTSLLCLGVVAACAASLSQFGTANAITDFPSRPIKVVVPAPVGSSDGYIRGLQDNLERKHGISIVVTSVPGGGGVIGTNSVKNSAPDGYTLLFAPSGALTTVPRLQTAQYTISDFIPIINLVNTPLVLAANKETPYATLRDYVDYARRNPGKVTFGSPGSGTIAHLVMEGLMQRAGIDLAHVPYTGGAPSISATLGGHIDTVIVTPSILMPIVRSNQLKALGISSKERFGPAREVPTFREGGIDLDLSVNFGLLAPKGTPQEIVDKLANAFNDVARDPQYRKAMEILFSEVALLKLSDYADALQVENKAIEEVLSKMPRR